MMGWYGANMGGAGVIMWLFWVGLIGLIIFLVIKLLPGSGASDRAAVGPAATTNDSPEQALDRQFALGQIDEQTYRARCAAMAEMRHLS